MTEPNIELSAEAKTAPDMVGHFHDDSGFKYPLAKLAVSDAGQPGIVIHGNDASDVREFHVIGQGFLHLREAARLRDFLCQHLGPPTQEANSPESAALQWTEHRPSVHKGRGGDRDYFVKPISPERWEAVFYVFYDGLGRARQEVAPGADFRSLHEAMQACEQHHQERQP